MKCAIGIFLLLGLSVTGQTITTVAGNGSAGFSGDGGPGTQAQINRVVGLATDSSGNLYLADERNNRVRKLTPGGIITTFAGSGAAGFSGDGGPATQAQLNAPLGVAVDASGNVYINDLNNRRIRKVDTNGNISTFAGNGSQTHSGDGGPATAAGMFLAIRGAVDGDGNYLFVDQGTHRVRRVDRNGVIQTIAGNGSAGSSGDGGAATAATFNNPTAIAVDGSGLIYITDQFNHRIRRIDRNGLITTVAGTAGPGFGGDSGPATNAIFNFPGSVCTGRNGDLFIVDTVNQRIRKVSGGNISTIAGTGAAGFSGDNGPALQATVSSPFACAVDGAGSLFIGDTENNRVRRIANAVETSAPQITAGGVANAASFQVGLSPGGLATIFGRNLSQGLNGFAVVDTVPWPTILAGTRVLVDNEAVPIYSVVNSNGAEQVSFLVPFTFNGRNNVKVSMSTPAGTGNVVDATIIGAQPGIFALAGNNGAILKGTDNSIVGANNPAAKGEAVVIFLTGMGPVSNAPAVGGPASTTTLSPTLVEPRVVIGGFQAGLLFSGLAPGFVGLYQINVLVPAAVASGSVDLSVEANGVRSNIVKIEIR